MSFRHFKIGVSHTLTSYACQTTLYRKRVSFIFTLRLSVTPYAKDLTNYRLYFSDTVNHTFTSYACYTTLYRKRVSYTLCTTPFSDTSKYLLVMLIRYFTGKGYPTLEYLPYTVLLHFIQKGIPHFIPYNFLPTT